MLLPGTPGGSVQQIVATNGPEPELIKFIVLDAASFNTSSVIRWVAPSPKITFAAFSAFTKPQP